MIVFMRQWEVQRFHAPAEYAGVGRMHLAELQRETPGLIKVVPVTGGLWCHRFFNPAARFVV